METCFLIRSIDRDQVCFELGDTHIEQAERIVQEMCESNLNKNHAMNGTARER